MARKLRFAPPGYWYHVTQRGNYRQKTFFAQADYEPFLELLLRYTATHDVGLLGYCLMPNHVHLIAQPHKDGALSICLFPDRAAWQQSLRTPIPRRDCTALRAATFGDCVLGPDALLDELEHRYQRLLRPKDPGRPKLSSSTEC